jgi:hypothetical protein
MLHLLSIEILKLQRNRSFVILMGLFVISVFGVNYVVSEIVNGSTVNITLAFPEVWAVTSYISSFLTVIIGLVIIMHTCSEYTYRTSRQNVIDGLSRDQFVTTKILFVIVLALFATIVTFISAFITGISADAPISFEGFRFISYFFIQTVTYISFAFLFALLFKKSVLATGVFLIYSLIIENILEKYINKINICIERLGGFLPIASSEHLLVPDKVKNVMKMVNITDPHPEYAYLTASVVYIILCYIACYYRYRKQDL